MAAAEVADLILIRAARASSTSGRSPCRKIAKLAGKPAFVALNALPAQATSLISEVGEALAVHGLELAPATIHQRAAYAHPRIDGRVAMEFEPKGKAAAEMTGAFPMACQAGENMTTCFRIFTKIKQHIYVKT